MRRTPAKIKSPPVKISGVMVSPMKAVANKTVTNGSAKRKELVTAAFTLFITWNQIKYPTNEHVTASYRIAPMLGDSMLVCRGGSFRLKRTELRKVRL